MTIGVVFRPQQPPEDLRAVVHAVEQAGVPELWLWEDCFLEGGLTAATAALAWSTRTRVGVGLLPVPLRNPALLAMELATVARLWPDRLVATLGHGVLEWMGQVGAAVESPMTLLGEYAAAVRDLLDGRRVDVAGRYVRLDGVALDWPPVRRPRCCRSARAAHDPARRRRGRRRAVGLGDRGDRSAGPGRWSTMPASASGRPGRSVVKAYTEVDPAHRPVRWRSGWPTGSAHSTRPEPTPSSSRPRGSGPTLDRWSRPSPPPGPAPQQLRPRKSVG